MAMCTKGLDFEDAIPQSQIPNSLRSNIDLAQQSEGIETYYARLPLPAVAPQSQQQVQTQPLLQQQQQLQQLQQLVQAQSMQQQQQQPQPLLQQQHQQQPQQLQIQVQPQAQLQIQHLQEQQQQQHQQQVQQQQVSLQNVKSVISHVQHPTQVPAQMATPNSEQGAQGARIAPFGKEDTAAELQNHAAKTQDTLVDAVENAEVAEIKRAVFRALTRLRAASIKEFDTIARLETQAIDEYNDAHHYRAENPLTYIHNDEPKVTEDKFTSFH